MRAADGTVARVVEARDASAEELAVGEYNAGLYVFDRAALAAALAGLGTGNAQGEIYLTDALERFDGTVAALVADDPLAAAGVNDRVDLAACEAALQTRLREELMRGGVTMPNPAAVSSRRASASGGTPCCCRAPTCAAPRASARAARSGRTPWSATPRSGRAARW